jgi:hypothetical protein
VRPLQLRLVEPADDELLALLHAERTAPNDRAFYAATDAIKDLYRSLDREAEVRVMGRVRALRQQVRAEQVPA